MAQRPERIRPQRPRKIEEDYLEEEELPEDYDEESYEEDDDYEEEGHAASGFSKAKEKFSLSMSKFSFGKKKGAEKASFQREAPVREKPVREKPSRINEDVEESAFKIDQDDNDIFFFKKEGSSEELEAAHAAVPELKVKNKRVTDVLEVMEIPETFEIPADVFLPDDVKKEEFDLQTPYGYEQGQVDSFQAKTYQSVKYLTDLLKLRNEHVAKLATAIDKLQVDANNLRYDNEIANGISIMTTGNDEDYENLYMEARLTIKRLEDTIEKLEKEQEGADSGLVTEASDAHDLLRDEISVLNRENADLKEEIYTLKNRLAYAEEELDAIEEQGAPLVVEKDEPHLDPIVTLDELPDAFDEDIKKTDLYKDAWDDSTELPEIDLDTLALDKSSDDKLPEVEEEDELALPPVEEEVLPNDPIPLGATTGSAFFIDENDSSGLSFVGVDPPEDEPLNDSMLLSEEDTEDDDELERMMNDWKNGE